MQILVKPLEFNIINDGKRTSYFRLDRETRQRDPISAYYFTIVLKVVFSLINANPDIEDLQFFSHIFLYCA